MGQKKKERKRVLKMTSGLVIFRAFFFAAFFFYISRKTVKLLTPSLLYISAHNMPGEIRLI